MSAWRRSGAAVRLLAVLCVTAGWAAAQQQQTTQTAGLTARPDRVRATIPRDCSDLAEGAITNVYGIWPSPDHEVTAFCDMHTDGGGWTVLQRRDKVQRHQNFFLKWEAYEQGFGKLREEFWLGLEHIWTITSAQDRQYDLRIDLQDFEGNKRYAVYQGFQISSERDGYRLSASNYTGDAGDGLSEHVNSSFSTYDRDHDNWSKNCASFMKAAWWYADCPGGSNLNGQYLRKGSYSFSGIWWATWKGWGSLKKTEMKIRPATIIHGGVVHKIRYA